MTFSERAVIGVLASGRGSNFATLLKCQQEGRFQNAEINCLISNRPSAGALVTASDAGLHSVCLRPKDFNSSTEYEQAIVAEFDRHGVNLLVLAGYMKIIGPAILDRYQENIINIHPSLLPSFPGLHAQEQAWEHGVAVSGCTVHFVDAGLDSGPIIGQRAVPVLPGDSADDLSARILEQEHKLFPICLKAITERPWKIEGRRVVFLDGQPEAL